MTTDANEMKFADPRARRLGKRIRERRELLGMTQQKLAEVSGVTQGHISQVENGQRLPTLPTLTKLKSALGLPDNDWLDWLEAAA